MAAFRRGSTSEFHPKIHYSRTTYDSPITSNVSQEARNDYAYAGSPDGPFQMVTPPWSPDSAGSDYGEELDSNQPDESDAIVAVSSTFHPTANLLPTPVDLLITSSDGVIFHVHTSKILTVDYEDFPSHPIGFTSPSFGTEYTALVPEVAAVLNVILHSAYGLSCARYCPPLDVLVAAVGAMPDYGLAPTAHVVPGMDLFNCILALAPTQPMKVYALASRHNLYQLARLVSSHLLSFSLSTLTDDVLYRIEPVYLKRLFVLHHNRLVALKRLLLAPPQTHSETLDCGFMDQRKLTRAWELASSYLAWESRPGA
ncbi:hypothetical protein C8Q77DRAFT_1160337 [Trametes polyzona]|nr:hypothetical protein C8Q77DRAFT_1160337 [Trametes polyzona]